MKRAALLVALLTASVCRCPGHCGFLLPPFNIALAATFASSLTASHSFFTDDAYGDSLNRVAARLRRQLAPLSAGSRRV